jgi:membrane protein YdbS with pleckstrin-like domain
MSWIDWTLICAIIGGFLLFLYGANNYNPTAGYGGIVLFIGSVVTYLIIFTYKELKKPTSTTE